eukprot:5233928-Pyramimonas_sp.AAC.1
MRTVEGLSGASVELLACIGTVVEQVGLPTIIGAGLNMSPDRIVSSGIVNRLGAQVVAPKGVMGTRGARMLDYFIVTAGLAKGISSVPSTSNLVTHLPVQMQFHAGIGRLHGLVFRKPPPLPTEPAI